MCPVDFPPRCCPSSRLVGGRPSRPDSSPIASRIRARMRSPVLLIACPFQCQRRLLIQYRCDASWCRDHGPTDLLPVIGTCIERLSHIVAGLWTCVKQLPNIGAELRVTPASAYGH